MWRRVATVASGAVLVAAVVATAAAGQRVVPASAPVDDAAARRVSTVDVPPGDALLVCPGPARLTDGSTGGDPQFRASPVPTTTRLGVAVLAGGAGALTGLGGATVAALAAPPAGAAAVLGRGVDAPLVVRVPASGSGVPQAAATVASTTTAGDLRGVAAAGCVAPGTDQWLVGGSTKVGDSTQLVLQNAGLTPATVSVTAFGEDGEVTLGSSAGLVVPPGKQVVRLLEAAAAGQDRLVVHVRAAGGVVATYLQHTSLDGIVPQGVDLVAPGAAPGRHVAVAGVVSRGEAIADARAPRLRLLAPTHAADVTVSLWGAQGRFRLRGAEQLSLDAGDVLDVGLGGVPAGTYTVTVDATADVVAGVVEQRPGSASGSDSGTPWDVAWAPGQAVPGGAGAPAGTALALPSGLASAVSLTALPAQRSVDARATGQVTATVRLLDASGREVGAKDVTVPAGVTTTLDVPALAAAAKASTVTGVVLDDVRASGGASLVWGAVVASGAPTSGIAGPASGQLVSVLAPVAGAAASGQVTVRQDPTLGAGGARPRP